VHRLLANESIKLYNNGAMERDFTHWRDIVDGIQLAMRYAQKKQNEQAIGGSNEVFNLGKGNVRTLYDFVQIILKSLDMSTDIDRNPLIELAPTPGGEVLFTSADLTKSRNVLGYNPMIELEEGIPEFIDWYKNDWKLKQYVRKRYLLISTFYIAMTDPRRLQNDIEYSYDAKFAIKYIRNWYESIKSVMQLDNLLYSALDLVIIHDGLSHDVFAHFDDIIFVNMGQYPNPLSGHARRRSPNDIRYFHIADYLASASDDEYEIVIMTDLFDVAFGRNPFEYLLRDKRMDVRTSNELYIGCEVVPSQSVWQWVSGHNALRSGSWYNWVHNRLRACFKKEIVDKCVAWMDSKQAMPTNPGIVAANKQTMSKYLDKMKDLLTRTNEFDTKDEQNCNYAAVLVSIVELCYEEKECHPINDAVFHSPYREFKVPSIGNKHDENEWVIYHKR